MSCFLAEKKLSVVLPTYNCRLLIERHLDSIEKWCDLAYEIIVVDSRSNDGTIELIKQRLKHPRIKIIERERGLYQSWNEGIAATTGEWIYISTAGDTIERGHLQHLVDLGTKVEADVVVSAPRFVDEMGAKHRDLNWPPKNIIRYYGSTEPVVLSKRDAVIWSYLFCPQAVLGSSASNLYRGSHLRCRPFPLDFLGAGDTAWIMRNAYETKVCLTPKVGSTFCIHNKPAVTTYSPRESILLKLIEEKKRGAEVLNSLKYIKVNLLREVSYFEKKHALHAERRAIWHSGTWTPGKIAKWILMTLKYLTLRTLLAIEHKRLRNTLIKLPKSEFLN